MLDRHVFFSMDVGENAVEDLKCFRRIDLAKQRNLGTASGGGTVFLVVHCGNDNLCDVCTCDLPDEKRMKLGKFGLDLCDWINQHQVGAPLPTDSRIHAELKSVRAPKNSFIRILVSFYQICTLKRKTHYAVCSIREIEGYSVSRTEIGQFLILFLPTYVS